MLLVVAVATVVAPCIAFRDAPGIAVVPSSFVTFPETVPAAFTVKLTPLLATPPAVTMTGPVVDPEGTGATILVALQLVGLAVVPLNVIVLVPWVAPNVVPLMVMESPTEPEVGERLFIFGVTTKVAPLLACPLTVTTTVPVMALAGTGATMLVLFQLVGLAETPLNVIVLVPCVAPKLLPAMVTDVPTGLEPGVMLSIFGLTVKATPLLARPFLVTTTLPVVAPAGTVATMPVLFQLVAVAVIPLKAIVLVPCVAPKFVPVTVTDVPMTPEVGARLLIVGAAIGDGMITKES